MTSDAGYEAEILFDGRGALLNAPTSSTATQRGGNDVRLDDDAANDEHHGGQEQVRSGFKQQFLVLFFN